MRHCLTYVYKFVIFMYLCIYMYVCGNSSHVVSTVAISNSKYVVSHKVNKKVVSVILTSLRLIHLQYFIRTDFLKLIMPYIVIKSLISQCFVMSDHSKYELQTNNQVSHHYIIIPAPNGFYACISFYTYMSIYHTIIALP